MRDMITPGCDIVDIEDVAEKWHDTWHTLAHASEERDAEQIEANANDPRGDNRCANGCVCTVAEKIDAGEYDAAWEMIPALWDNNDTDGLWEAAGLDDADVDFMHDARDLQDELGVDLSDAGRNEPVLIHDDHFETYAEQLADDIGAIDTNAGWPLNFIDWEAAAEALKQDYTEVTYGGQTYWWRAY